MTNLEPPVEYARIVSDALAERLVQDAKLHLNLPEDFIVITEDKVRLCLIGHLEQLEARREWVAPTGILIAIVTTFVTTTFRDFLVSADTWKAIFIVTGVLVGIWLVRSIKVALQSPSVDDVVAEMKKESKQSLEQAKSGM